MPIFNFGITRNDIEALSAIDNLIFDQTRLEILSSLQSIDVQACPGSGKTTLVAAKLLLLSRKWLYKHQGVCVLTHTNVAKNEITERLQKSKVPEAWSLLSYPHFIGTIQEFVDRFLGIPLLRTRGIDVRLIDTDRCVELLYSQLKPTTRHYVDTKNSVQSTNILYDFGLKIESNSIVANVPTFPNGSDSPSYHDLKETRFRLIKEGYCFYHDMYVFAEKILIDNESIVSGMQKRFPLIFIDEMQDTQKFQDDLLQKIFPLTASNIAVQRFGDPDQAIFNGINGEMPNDTYNQKPKDDFDFVIGKSHRFDNSIAHKLRGLSSNSVAIASELSNAALQEMRSCHVNGKDFQHTIFVYGDTSIASVIPSFVKELSQQFDSAKLVKNTFTAKVVGAIGKELERPEQLRISSYWSDYQKKRSNQSFKESSLYEAVLYSRQHSQEHWSKHYKRLNNCILKILEMLGKKDSEGGFYTFISMRNYLKVRHQWNDYQKLMYWFLNDVDDISAEIWEEKMKALKIILDTISMPQNVASYLEYPVVTPSLPLSEQISTTNLYEIEGVKIEIATIHSVKGETHDATLILETKHSRWFDVQEMIDFLTSSPQIKPIYNTSSPNSKNSVLAKFMKQLYVAMSRPRYLLCLAIHKDRLSENQQNTLVEQGWCIQHLGVSS